MQDIKTARILRAELAPHWGRMAAFQWAQIVAVNVGPPPTVDVKIDGSGATTTSMYYLESYNPQVGDVVMVARMVGPAQTARVVLGQVAHNWGFGNGETLIDSITLGAGTTTWNVPTGNPWYSLKLRFRKITTSNAGQGDNVALRFNADSTAANYFSTTWDQSSNAGAVSAFTNATAGAVAWTCLATGTTLGANYAGSAVFEIPGYADSDFKRIMGQTTNGDVTTNQMSMRWGLWKSTNAITSLGFLSSVGPGTNTLGGIVDIFGVPGHV